ncbi:MAG: hypothetical protein JWO57_4124 [Pseudonocardiales bacterium]|nr:hypothetical protein [Pseudonocardiales bacterium]
MSNANLRGEYLRLRENADEKRQDRDALGSPAAPYGTRDHIGANDAATRERWHRLNDEMIDLERRRDEALDRLRESRHVRDEDGWADQSSTRTDL